ncbi:Uncharacterised protein [Bordetella pertussis]|nr:Uncharacterised protein [Bordetella pertussis]CPJ97286.1 Uncharacterised protein [Bordetella pertussis]CPP62049.1 Uncharacterised protein [Bordetella pertussis]CPQ39017.1 Uncharacterised protein [Bordetella pertussis]CRE32103.1 Uncharacterised protein [Bordetella pertussis]
MRQRIVLAVHRIGFLAVQAVREVAVGVVHGVAGEQVALPAEAHVQVHGVVAVGFPREQRAQVLVDDALASGGRGVAVVAGVRVAGVDVAGIRIGLVVVAVQPHAQRVADRRADARIDAVGVALAAVFRLVRVVGDGAGGAIGGALGDDVDHAAHGPGTVAGGGRAADHFDALDFLGGHPVGVPARVPVAVPAIAHRIARGDGLAVDQDEGVLGAHAADVDLAAVAPRAAGAVAGQVDAGFAADQVGQVIGGRAAGDLLGGDDRDAQRLLDFLFGRAQHLHRRHLLHLRRIVDLGGRLRHGQAGCGQQD